MVIYLGKKSIISGKNDSQNKRLPTRIVLHQTKLSWHRRGYFRRCVYLPHDYRTVFELDPVIRTV